MSYLMLAGTAVVVSLGQAASPRLAKYYASGDSKAFTHLLMKLVAIGSLLGASSVLTVVLYGQRLLKILYGPEYTGYHEAFVWLMVAAGIGYVGTFLAYAMMATRYFKVQAPLLLTVVVITFIGSALLVPRVGVLGASITLVIAMITQVIGSSAIVLIALIRQATPLSTKSAAMDFNCTVDELTENALADL
jgi:O-antigen/teichoic acid export membrane protein